jgi:hypothetical protein
LEKAAALRAGDRVVGHAHVGSCRVTNQPGGRRFRRD